MLEKLSEMPFTATERQELVDFDIEVNGRIRVSRITNSNGKVAGIETRKVQLPDGLPFKPANVSDVEGNEGLRTDFDAVIMAIGMRSTLPREQVNGIFYAGDISNGPTTVVEAVASGKNTALEIDAYLNTAAMHLFPNKQPNRLSPCPAMNPLPVSWRPSSSGARSARPISSPPPP